MGEVDVPTLLTPTETARLLGVTIQTLANWRTARRYALPWVLVGRSVRYEADALRAWLETRRQGGEAA